MTEDDFVFAYASPLVVSPVLPEEPVLDPTLLHDPRPDDGGRPTGAEEPVER